MIKGIFFLNYAYMYCNVLVFHVGLIELWLMWDMQGHAGFGKYYVKYYDSYCLMHPSQQYCCILSVVV